MVWVVTIGFVVTSFLLFLIWESVEAVRKEFSEFRLGYNETESTKDYDSQIVRSLLVEQREETESGAKRIQEEVESLKDLIRDGETGLPALTEQSESLTSALSNIENYLQSIERHHRSSPYGPGTG